ncbi:aminoacylase-1 [Halyomorpha halys]|uniref:aminoacylase-1 n=1 Tax=Halyomorpha halys TaxID=286706 RepID=UPI0006D4C9CF|nr:aminoacylase-1-like [Halyomorpha halys]
MVEDVIENFQEYLRIRSDHPVPDYKGCVAFVKKKADEYGLKTKIFHLDEKRPVLIVTLEGTNPNLPSILLNSHTDVVQAFQKDWSHDPFAAEIDQEGNIYARGSQDMKCVTIAQLEALRRIKFSEVKLKRTVHMTLVPDEEIGSQEGMAKFVHTQTFKDLNIAFDIDEGCCSPKEIFVVLNNERCTWEVLIHCLGTTGHGLQVHKDTAGEKLRTVIDHFMDLRECEIKKLQGMTDLGNITTINLTQIKGGVQNNILPPELVVGFDIKIAADGNHEDMEKWINDVCKKAGKGVYPEYVQKNIKVTPTLLTDENPFWSAIDSTLKTLDLNYLKINSPGATDARFVRRVGVPAVGFSPFNNTPLRLHDNDEFINKNIFLTGISIYEKLIRNVANV